MRDILIVTQDNVLEIAGSLLLNAKHTVNNSNSFGFHNKESKEIAYKMLDDLYEKLKKLGYNPSGLFYHIQLQIDYTYGYAPITEWAELKNELMDHFEFNLLVDGKYYAYGKSLMAKYNIKYKNENPIMKQPHFSDCDLKYICSNFEEESLKTLAFVTGKKERDILIEIERLKKWWLFDYYKNYCY